MFDLFPKFGSAGDSITPEELGWKTWKTDTQIPNYVQAQDGMIGELLKENNKLKDENKNLEDILKSIEEDGTTEHNNAINLRESVVHLREEAFKKLNEQADIISELTKEVIGLRHLKKENVELIEKLLEKEGKSYGMTFNEAKTQIIQNDYKKCAEERDEYKHQLNAANKEIEVLKKERDILKRWKYEQLIVNKQWDKVDDYMRNHDDAPLGNFVANTCLDFLRERDELKHQLNAAKKSLVRWEKWEEVCDYINNHDELKTHGFIVHKQCLRFLKERDELKTELEKLKKDETQKHSMYPVHWGGYDGAASAYPKQYSDWLNEQKDKAIKEKYDKNIIDFVESEFSNDDPLEGEQVEEVVDILKNMKSQGFEDYDPSDFEQPVKEVEFNSEELLKRVTECADTLDSLPKSFPDEFQDEKTTAENLEERFDAGENVLDYFGEWKCPCNKCKETKTEKSWEEAASDLALKVAKLEEIVENQLKQIEEIKAFGNKLTKMTYQDSYYEYFKKHGKWPW